MSEQDERKIADDLDTRFDHHPPPNKATEAAHGNWRQAVKAVAAYAMWELPAGRERSLVLTHLEEVMMWGNAAIARNPRGSREWPKPVDSPPEAAKAE